jgi:outer membrane protein assembly factor BamB
MNESLIRQLAVPGSGIIIAGALFEHHVMLFDLHTGRLTSRFDTIVDFGGKRLAIDSQGAVCVAAGWTKGVAAYRATSGETLWHRKDLRHAQYLNVSGDGCTVYCGLDQKALQVLDAATGRTEERLPGVSRIIESRFSRARLLNRPKAAYQIRGKGDFEIERLSFGLLHAEFGEDLLCISEVGGPVRCIDCTTGHVIWNYDPGQDHHVLHVGYRNDNSAFYGIRWNYAKGGPFLLVRMQDGKAETINSVANAFTAEFCLDGTRLVTSAGVLFDSSDGVERMQLILP